MCVDAKQVKGQEQERPIVAGATCKRCGGKLLVARVERGVDRVARIHRCQDCGEAYVSTQEIE